MQAEDTFIPETVNEMLLLDILCQYNGVSDMFGQRGHVCQATELWRIRCKELENGYN